MEKNGHPKHRLETPQARQILVPNPLPQLTSRVGRSLMDRRTQPPRKAIRNKVRRILKAPPNNHSNTPRRDMPVRTPYTPNYAPHDVPPQKTVYT